MNVSAERGLALLAAEDGDLLEADETLSALIERLERARSKQPDDGSLVFELCTCLLDRAKVRAWAVRPAEALQDIDRAAPMVDGLKPLNRQLLRMNLLDMRTRLLGAPYSPVHDAPAARRALADLRLEAENSAERWIPDAVELQLARHERNWSRMVELAPGLCAHLAQRGLVRGVQALQVLAARAWLELGRPEQALEPAMQAHAFFRTEGPPDIAAHATMALARAKGRAQDWPLAEEALAVVERLTRSQRSVFDQQRYLVEKLQVFEDGLRLALQQMADAPDAAERERALVRAWQVAERSKSFSLRQAMTQGGWLRAIDADRAAELDDLDRQLEAVEAQVEYTEAILARQAELATRRQQVLQAAMQRSPLLAQTQAPSVLELAATLRALPAGVGVVSWYWLQEPDGWRLHIFHAAGDRVPRHACATWSDEEAQALESARLAHATGNLFQLKLAMPAALGDKALPGVVLDALADCHTLLLTPHRHLRQMPLHATQVSRPASRGGGTELLVERFAVQVLATLALPFPKPAERDRRWRVLLMGCAQDGFHNPRLDDVPLELDELAAMWSAAGHQVEHHALPAQARLADHVPLSEWPRFDLIHLACHGRFVPGSPLDATLYLGSEALRASEFFALELRAEVVSLSACDVGQHGNTLDGLALVGDEWLGLALPLFQAGTRHLLTSLWQANSAVARAFMQDFHKALAQGLAPARAHRQACLGQMRGRYGFWANWQLAGFPV